MGSRWPLLQPPCSTDFPVRRRHRSSYLPIDTFLLPHAANRKFTTQYADLYFARLAQLKLHVESVAQKAWEGFDLAGEKPTRVERVLDVRQGQLCWVVGTIFMDMPLKPSILDDLAKESWIVSPPTRHKYFVNYGVDDDSSSSDFGGRVMFEDESGRLQIVGKYLHGFLLCTGCIVAVLGTETKNGTFEVIDIQVAGLPPQPNRWLITTQPEIDPNFLIAAPTLSQQSNSPSSSKIAIVSGLEINGSDDDQLSLDLLVEYLTGDLDTDLSQSRVSRLMIAGNSLANASPIPTREDSATNPSKNLRHKSVRKFGQEPSSYNQSPATRLDALLYTLLASLPITILPGLSDPVGVSLPQQPLHPAFFPSCRSYIRSPAEMDAQDNTPSWFDCGTNPWEGEIDGWRLLATSGQPVNDMFKYVQDSDRLALIESILNWRNIAPTAPDTLSCYPFQDKDPFLLKTCPHVLIAADQPRFETSVISGDEGQTVRLIAVPSFRKTGCFVIVDMESLEAEVVNIHVQSEI